MGGQTQTSAIGADQFGRPATGQLGQPDFGKDGGWCGRSVLAHPALEGGKFEAVLLSELPGREAGVVQAAHPLGALGGRGTRSASARRGRGGSDGVGDKFMSHAPHCAPSSPARQMHLPGRLRNTHPVSAFRRCRRRREGEGDKVRCSI